VMFIIPRGFGKNYPLLTYFAVNEYSDFSLALNFIFDIFAQFF